MTYTEDLDAGFGRQPSSCDELLFARALHALQALVVVPEFLRRTRGADQVPPLECATRCLGTAGKSSRQSSYSGVASYSVGVGEA